MANKKITDATTATSVAGTDKVFLNQGGDLKQVDLNSAVANSQAVQTLNSNLGNGLNIYKNILFMSNNDVFTLSYDELKITSGRGVATIILSVSSEYNNAAKYFGIIHKCGYNINQDIVYDIIKTNINIVLSQTTDIRVQYLFSESQYVTISAIVLQ